ncbi:MAG: hypothetical protein U0166_25880 [Acidobacteriota bacterium]
MSTTFRARFRQIGAVVGLEARRNLAGRQAIGLYVLAVMPMGPALSFLLPDNPRVPLEEIPMLFAKLFQGAYLPFLTFFACASIFSDLFRRDIVQKSLHYWLLAPIRREVLALGKLAGAMLTVIVVFELSTLGTYMSYYVPYGSEIMERQLLSRTSLHALGAYLLTTAVAVVSYSVLFFAIGLCFKSPIIPGLIIWLWESVNNFLPSVLKCFSLIYYLKALLPVEVHEDIFALSSDPPTPWLSAAGLLVFALVCMTVAVFQVRKLEVSYAAE